MSRFSYMRLGEGLSGLRNSLIPSASGDEENAIGLLGNNSSSGNDREIDEERDWCNLLPGLSWTERLIGCGTCMVAGYLLSFGSFFRVKELMFGNPLPFVINVTIGNVIALCGSCFLSGPKSQMKRMCDEKRKITSALYLSSLVMTLVVAFIPGFPNAIKGPLLLTLVICQYVFITWYILSYIPYARETVVNFFRRRNIIRSDSFAETLSSM